MSCSREMTLKEFVRTLPDIHKARREYVAIRCQLASLIGVCRSIVRDYEDGWPSKDNLQANLPRCREVLIKTKIDRASYSDFDSGHDIAHDLGDNE